MTDEIILRRPDDWHLHLRDGAMLRAVLPATAAAFARAIVMPNLVPPVITAADAAAYRARIQAALPPGADFTPLMTLYLAERTDPADVVAGARDGVVTAVKLYPAHATTNSAQGVADVDQAMPVLEAMAAADVPLLIHGEVTDPEVDIFDREAVFIDRVLDPLRRRLPELRMVLEHVTTREAVDYVRSVGSAAAPGRLAATITPHHLEINRTDLFRGGIRPHLYCLPIAKRETHRLALRAAATSGDPRFFLGTDSAPHPISAKEAACGCAGVFNAPTALASYAAAFEAEGALDRLEGFASLAGPAFYRLPPNETRIRLARIPHTPPETLTGAEVRVHRGGETLAWRLDAAFA